MVIVHFDRRSNLEMRLPDLMPHEITKQIAEELQDGEYWTTNPLWLDVFQAHQIVLPSGRTLVNCDHLVKNWLSSKNSDMATHIVHSNFLRGVLCQS